MTAEPRRGKQGSEPRRDLGRMLRPEPVVLGEEALVPDRNVIEPPPNRFTHVLTNDEPYRFDRPEHRREADGVLAAGTPVALLVDGPERCRVVDGRGLYVEVSRASLRELPQSS
jgi:hypothetical protein